jgi:adenine-specific DNA-methyltransferase
MPDDVLQRFNLASERPADDRAMGLRDHFPEIFHEDRIDFDALRRSLGDSVDAGSERFGLTWPGKAQCMRVIQEPSTGTLVPMPDESEEWNTTQNVIIEGENLEVLKLLQKAYYGQVKLIYLDPPYNTGKEFIYPDNFREGLADYLRYSGQTDDAGLKLTANAETDGRYHSKWLSMMFPRLFLARNLLAEDGVIFVSIDDHEIHNLRLLMNEIFGEENFAAEIAVVNNLKGRNDREHVATAHEYLLMYVRGTFESRGLALTDQQRAEYRYTTDDGRAFQWRDLRKRGGADTRAARPNLFFPLYVDPSDGAVAMAPSETHHIEVIPTKSDGIEGCWRWGREKVAATLSDLKGIKVETKERWNISYRVFLETDNGQRTSKPKSVWTGPEFSTDAATKSLRALLPEMDLITPKPLGLLKKIIEQSMGPGDLCLDFFAGTGTTGHAVLDANRKQSQHLRFMLVQLPEPLEDPNYPTLSAITRERVRRAAQSLQEADATLPLENEPGDVGFRSYRLRRSNFTVWDAGASDGETLGRQLELSVDHVAEGATEESMLAELLLKAGYELTSPVERVDFAGAHGYLVAGGALIVCLSRALSIEAFESMVSREPAMIIVLDAGFQGHDELKVNALQTVRARNQQSGTDIALRVV